MDIGVSKFSMWEALREKEDFEQRGIRPSYLAPVDDDDDENDNTAGVFTMQTQTQTQTQTNTQNLDDPVDREPKIPHAMLKLVLTDGKTRLPAIEMAPVPQLSVELPIGTKVLVTRGHVLQPTGTLCLLPDCIQVLGGSPMQYQELTLRSRIERILDIKSN
ncbi:hypothetical protein FB639_006092 [Coemansia asiatica]|nr:hypothetical protein FB639_006092 [Coemansia asiatica]